MQINCRFHEIFANFYGHPLGSSALEDKIGSMGIYLHLCRRGNMDLLPAHVQFKVGMVVPAKDVGQVRNVGQGRLDLFFVLEGIPGIHEPVSAKAGRMVHK